MKKIFLGIIIGIAITIAAFTAYQGVKYYLFSKQMGTRVYRAAETSFMQALPEAEISEIATEPFKGKAEVNYAHDELYKVTIYYQLASQYKNISFIVGVYKNHIIGPPEVELLQLDDNAVILYERK